MNFDKYINLPYKNKGRDFDGVDCWGLYYLIFKEELNIILPDFTELVYLTDWYKKEQNLFIEQEDKRDTSIWKLIDKPYKRFDCILFYLSGSLKIVNHCGMVIGGNKFIHIYETIKSSIDDLGNPYWSNKIYKAFRYVR